MTEGRSITKVCTECREPVSGILYLQNHLINDHKLELSSLELHFETELEFKTWFENEERRRRCNFIASESNDSYLCDSASVFKSSTKERSHGIIRMYQGMCPASIAFTRSTQTGLIVNYQTLHLGHGKKAPVPVPANEDADGVLVEYLADSPNQNDEDDPNPKIPQKREKTHPQDHLMAKDIENLENWIRSEETKVEKSSVLFYKAKNVQHELFDSSDFVLMIQLPMQRHVLKMFDKRCICIDATHESFGSDLKFITILTVDIDNDAFPIACCFCTKDDLQTIKLFLERIRDTCGEIACDVLMSHHDSIYEQAWCEVMGVPKTVLFTSWSVHQSFRNCLRTIKSQKRRLAVEKSVKSMYSATDCHDFDTRFDNLLVDLMYGEMTLEMGQYFLKHFESTRCKWSPAYRSRLDLNLDVSVDLYHMQLKCDLICRKLYKYVFKCVESVIGYVASAFRPRIMRQSLEGGKSAKKTYESEKDVSQEVITLRDTSWLVPLKDDSQRFHYVKATRHFKSCVEECEMKPTDCDVCYKALKCTCLDYSDKSVICEHIFSVLRQRNKPKTAPETIAEMSVRHTNSFRKSRMVIKVSTSSWIVSEQDKSHFFHVQETDHKTSGCKTSCRLSCPQCFVCYQAMNCSCDVYKKRLKICEHIHCVAYKLNELTPENEGENDTKTTAPLAVNPKTIDEAYETLLRHRLGVLTTQSIDEVSPTIWRVTLDREAKEYCFLKLTDHFTLCNRSCTIVCRDCKVCYKSATCSCDDYKFRRNICEHIHGLVKKLGKRGKFSRHEEVNDDKAAMLLRHRSGVAMSALVMVLTASTYILEIKGGPFKYYLIELTRHFTVCNSKCEKFCSNCLVCFKAATCTCDDYLSSFNMCKHIHAVVDTLNQNARNSSRRLWIAPNRRLADSKISRQLVVKEILASGLNKKGKAKSISKAELERLDSSAAILALLSKQQPMSSAQNKDADNPDESISKEMFLRQSLLFKVNKENNRDEIDLSNVESMDPIDVCATVEIPSDAAPANNRMEVSIPRNEEWNMPMDTTEIPFTMEAGIDNRTIVSIDDEERTYKKRMSILLSSAPLKRMKTETEDSDELVDVSTGAVEYEHSYMNT